MAKRVYELAKELGIKNREIIDKLNSIGIETKSHMKTLTEQEIEKLHQVLPKRQGGSGDETTIVKVEQRNPAKTGEKSAKKTASGTRSDSVKGRASAGEKSGAKAKGDRKNTGKEPERKERTGDKKTASRNRDDAGRKGSPKKSGRDGKPEDGKNDRRQASGAGGGGKPSGQSRKDASAGTRDHRGAKKKEERGGDGGSKRKTENRRGSSGPAPANISKPKHSHRKNQRKEQRKEAALRAEEAAAAIPAGAVVVTVPITVRGLAEQIDESESRIIMALMKMGIMANVNQNLDADIVQLLGEELHKQIVVGQEEKEVLEDGIENFTDREEDLRPRPPIITVMGHVDHGKTSLLDRIRSTNVTSQESGGITQHIGASEIVHNGQRIVFLDTPGHEAFTAMRARGAYVTDIAVLVVAADDSVKPQTIEAISHAKAANVPIIVAINKIDKPGANVDKVKKDLADNGVLIEDWGGDVICVPVSAKTGEGIENLLEMILLQAEILELKANPNRLGMGTIIEARLDRQRGPVASLLVLNGTLHAGMSIVAGNCSGRIKAMTNYRGDAIKKAGPATAVEILGMDDVPEAGDSFHAVSNDRLAREIAEKRRTKQREEVLQKSAGVTLEQLFSRIEQGEVKELNLLIKADVQGSVGALVSSLEKLKTDDVAVRIVHTGVGAINESDIMLASTTGAIIIGFNVRPSSAVTTQAQNEGVEIRTYRVIYEAIDEVEKALQGLLDPEFREEVLGTIEVRNTFKVSSVGTIAGGYVTDGKIERNADIRLIRDSIVIHEGKVSSLKRYKDDVKEVSKGFECGIGLENYNDIKEGDVIEAFKMVEVERS